MLFSVTFIRHIQRIFLTIHNIYTVTTTNIITTTTTTTNIITVLPSKQLPGHFTKFIMPSNHTCCIICLNLNAISSVETKHFEAASRAYVWANGILSCYSPCSNRVPTLKLLVSLVLEINRGPKILINCFHVFSSVCRIGRILNTEEMASFNQEIA